MSHYRAVVFDCDSTLAALEGIDTLAAGVRDQVRALTEAAMAGGVPLEEVYGRCLDLIRPSRSDIDALTARYIDAIVEDAPDTIAALQDHGVDVRIISGGLLPAVLGLAEHLGVAPEAVAAVPIRFADDGQYAGFDPTPPARSGGKPAVIRAWKAGGMPGPVMFVGDGATDLEAAGDVDLFVAYAGVVERPAVVEAAPVVIRSRSLAPVVPLALGDEPPDGAAPAVFGRGKSLIDNGMVEWR